MSNSYRKECYDSNPFVKVHYSFGNREVGSTLQFLHYDKDLIIEYYRKGEASLRIEGNLYEVNEGDIVILNPDEMHLSNRKDSCYMEKIVLHISEELPTIFGEERSEFLEIIARKAKGKGNLIPAQVAQNLGVSEKIIRCMSLAKDASSDANMLLICKAMELLYDISNLVEKVDDFRMETASSNKTVNKIVDYINRHYTEELTLEIIANRFHFSKYYVSHLFKDFVGISPYDYLIARRLYVCNNLIRAGYTVKEACFEVGFSNYSNFYRLYKKHFKITPAQFKDQLKH